MFSRLLAQIGNMFKKKGEKLTQPSEFMILDPWKEDIKHDVDYIRKQLSRAAIIK